MRIGTFDRLALVLVVALAALAGCGSRYGVSEEALDRLAIVNTDRLSAASKRARDAAATCCSTAAKFSRMMMALAPESLS